MNLFICHFLTPSIHKHEDIDTYVHTHTSDGVINSSSVPRTQGFNGLGGLESQINLTPGYQL